MRYPGQWMVSTDDRILEIMLADGAKSASMVADYRQIHVSSRQITNRMSKLASHDLISGLGNGIYVLSRRGRGYLAGDYDVDSNEWMSDPPDMVGPFGLSEEDVYDSKSPDEI